MSEADIAKQLNLGQSTIHYHNVQDLASKIWLRLNLGQSTIHYHKANSLKELKRIMEEKYGAKCK